MKTATAIGALLGGSLLAITATTGALATIDPIPGVDIIVKKNPGGTPIKVGDCQSGGGKVVKKGAEWVCTGLPATAKQKH
jgi:hypothetical protein